MLWKLQKHILHTHSRLGGVSVFCHLGIHSPKNLSNHLSATHGLPALRCASSADLATTSATANSALGDVHTANGDKINRKNLQKSDFAFFGVLET